MECLLVSLQALSQTALKDTVGVMAMFFVCFHRHHKILLNQNPHLQWRVSCL